MHDERNVPTLEMAEKARDIRLIATLVTFGTLWIVPEDIWKAVIEPFRYDKNSDRKNHPGCSVLNSTITDTVIPVLHGTSKKHGRHSVPVQFKTDGNRTTWFGGLPPRQIPISYWKQPSISEEKITPMKDKGMLDEHEIKAMRKLMTVQPSEWPGRTKW